MFAPMAMRHTTFREPLRAGDPRDAGQRFDGLWSEGYKREPHPKLEVYRASLGKPLLHPDDPHIAAIATDQPLPSARVPVVNLDDIEAIVDVLLKHAAPLDALFADAC